MGGNNFNKFLSIIDLMRLDRRMKKKITPSNYYFCNSKGARFIHFFYLLVL